MPYNAVGFPFIETKLFTRQVQQYLDDDAYRRLQQFLIERPGAGTVIPGTGGVRKLRWPAPGHGKRGGYRIIYFVGNEEGVIWMLTMYPKSVREDIPARALRAIRKEVDDG